MTQWQHSSRSLRQTTCRRQFGLQEMCRSVEKAYRRLLSRSPSVCLSCLSSSFFFQTTDSHFLGHHGKSLVIIFSAVSLPTHTLSLASSLPLLEKLWIMLVSPSLQGLRLGGTSHRAAALFIPFRNGDFFFLEARQSRFKLAWSLNTPQCTILRQTA